MFYAGLGVLGVVLIMMDLSTVFIVVITVAMIDLDLFGWMITFGIVLSVVSYVELVCLPLQKDFKFQFFCVVGHGGRSHNRLSNPHLPCNCIRNWKTK